MSRRVTDLAWKQTLPVMQKFVLLALANRHNAETERCDPSMELIAADCGMSTATVKRAVRELVQKGLISVRSRRHAGVRTSNYYRLHFEYVMACPDVETEPVLAASDSPRRSVAVASDHGSQSSLPGITVIPSHGSQRPLNQELEPVKEPLRKTSASARGEAVPGTLAELREVLADPVTPEEPVSVQADALWKQVRDRVKARVDRGSFETWLKPLHGLRMEAGVLHLRAPSDAFGNVGERFSGPIRDALAELGVPVSRVRVCPDAPVEAAYLGTVGLHPPRARAWRGGPPYVH